MSEVKRKNEKWDYQKLRSSFIILEKNEMEEFLEERKIKRDYEAVKLLREAEERGYTSISMMELNVDDETLKAKSIMSVKKVNLNYNKIKSLASVSQAFP